MIPKALALSLKAVELGWLETEAEQARRQFWLMHELAQTRPGFTDMTRRPRVELVSPGLRAIKRVTQAWLAQQGDTRRVSSHRHLNPKLPCIRAQEWVSAACRRR